MSRRPLGEKPMTDAERQRKRRELLRQERAPAPGRRDTASEALREARREIASLRAQLAAALAQTPVAKNWNDWLMVGEALRVGRRLSMHRAGTNRPAGKGYAQEFSRWLVANRLDDMDGADRVKLLVVMDNLPAIEAWRLSLTDAKRMTLNHPATVLRNWREDTADARPTDSNAARRR
jgi:hypothetical protein